MRFVLSLSLYAGILAAIGCGDGKTPIKEATAEDIQQQKESEARAKAAESARQQQQPRENAHGQAVGEQERARRR